MLRIPKSFSGNFINRHFYSHYLKKNKLHIINMGECYDWSYLAHRLFGAQLWTTDYHAWVEMKVRESKTKKYIAKFFDSESPQGVKHHQELKCNYTWGHNATKPRKIEVEKFKKYWNRNGGGNRHHWESILENNLKKVLKDHYKETTPIFPVSCGM